MKQFREFVDQRQTSWCAHCGGPIESIDHVPSKVLLDEPYPDNLPSVSSCLACNNSVSLDEEYLACLIECTICGSVEPKSIKREKVRRILSDTPALAARLAQARSMDPFGKTQFAFESQRVNQVILKLARGHSIFELGEPMFEEPSALNVAPLIALMPEQRNAFEQVPAWHGWPEIGSRAFQRACGIGEPLGWIEVQQGRYRYLAFGEGDVVIRIVLSEYLAAEVVWSRD